MPKVKRLILGITGGIASGKTTVMRILGGGGVPTVSSDDLAHESIRRGRPAYQSILRQFGRGILDSNGQISRRRLGKIVFAVPKKRKTLEKIIHPWVIKGLKAFITRHPKGVVALDIPLLFEARLKGLVNKVVVVYCTRAQQIKRLRRRMGLSHHEALDRLRTQMPLGQKCQRADIVLQNTGTFLHLRRQVVSRLPIPRVS